jgi:hypothetical protein
MDGQPSEKGMNGENRQNGVNGENAPPLNLHAFWTTLGSPGSRSSHLEIVPLPKGT